MGYKEMFDKTIEDSTTYRNAVKALSYMKSGGTAHASVIAHQERRIAKLENCDLHELLEREEREAWENNLQNKLYFDRRLA